MNNNSIENDLGRLASNLEIEYFLAFANSGGETRSYGDTVFAAVTGRESNDRNGVVASPGSKPNDVIEAIDWVLSLKVPASLFCWEQSASNDLIEMLKVRKIVPDQDSIGMSIDINDVIQFESPSNIDVSDVNSPQLIEQWLDVAEGNGWLSETNPEKDRNLLKRNIERLVSDNIARYCIATVDGKTVGMGGMFCTDAGCLLTDVATLPQFQRQGVGAAIMNSWFEYCRNQPVRNLVLFPTPEGMRLYEKHGMHKLAMPVDTVFYLN